MFYCNKCAKERGWQISLVKSFGNCDICGVQSECNDTPSKYLPIKKCD